MTTHECNFFKSIFARIFILNGDGMNKFQSNLQELMDEKQLNRLQLSKILNISASTLDGYFNKNYFPSLEIAEILAKFFNCSLNYLLGLTDEIGYYHERQSRTFFEVFESLLKENKVSSADVLKKLNMSRSDFYDWKKGKIPRMINLIELAKYFKVSLDFLVGKED